MLIDDETYLPYGSPASSAVSTIEEELDDEILRTQCVLAVEDVSDDEDDALAAQLTPSAFGSAAVASPASPVPLGIPVKSDEVRSHARMNLSVPFSRSHDAQTAGALFDSNAGVFYVPPRTPLISFREWLPWDVDVVECYADGFIHHDVRHAAGPVKSDGSPDMRSKANKDVRRMTSPPANPPPVSRSTISPPGEVGLVDLLSPEMHTAPPLRVSGL